MSRAGESATVIDDVGPVLADLEASPTPYHAADRAAALLDEAGFSECRADQELVAGSGGRYLRVGGTLIAWLQQPGQSGYIIVGAHTDSPNLRLRPRPARLSEGFVQLGVEIYGGVLLNSWLDRDLGLAGRVSVGGPDGYEVRLVRVDEPILRVPQLAIHLNREIKTDGLKLNPQQHLTPIWQLADDVDNSTDPDGLNDRFRRFVADLLNVAPDRILAHDLMAFDVQAPALVGGDRRMLASARIDNLVSTFTGTRAMSALAGDSSDLRRCPVLVLYDHEEVGSLSATGASGSLLASTLERIASARGLDRSQFLAEMNASVAISADASHATHPNYVDRHDGDHPIRLNGGVVIKSNANMRYATDSISEAFAATVADEAGLRVQFYNHRNDLPCGSTIGPTLSARLGVPTVDLGIPQLGMHSIRELAGVDDVVDLARLLHTAWRSDLEMV